MRRIGFALSVALLLPCVGGAQPAGKVYHLGMLSPGARPAQSNVMAFNVLPTMLREMEYTLVVESRFADGKLDRLSGLASELVQLRVDALVAASPPAVKEGLNKSCRRTPRKLQSLENGHTEARW